MFNTTSPKVRKQVFGILTNRWALSCLGTLTFQQLLEASSTFWLVKLMQSITSGQPFLTYLLIYVTSLILPHIPWCISYIIKTTWKQEAERSFINAFIASNKNHLAEWNNKTLKDEKLSILTSQGPTALNELIDYVFDLFSYALSVCFNITALAIVVEPFFAVAYGLSVSVVIIIMKIQRKHLRNLTQLALSARISLCQSLLASWDNVLLGNEYNYKLWADQTSQRLGICLQRNIKVERYNQTLAIFISLMTTIPSMLVVLYYMYSNQHDRVMLSSFIVTLPILFIILNYTHHTLTLAFRWTMHRSKLMTIYRAIESAKEPEVPLMKKIDWNKIFVDSNAPVVNFNEPKQAPLPVLSYDNLLKYASKAGRITVRGENGVGKSSALLLVKKALMGRAFFLPTHNQLSFSVESHGTSTGESLKSRLMEILNHVEADVLLLDEWNANLDSENQHMLSALIDKLSEKKCIIEVRHR